MNDFFTKIDGYGIDLNALLSSVETSLQYQYFGDIDNRMNQNNDVIEILNDVYDITSNMKSKALSLSITDTQEGAISSLSELTDAYNDYVNAYNSDIRTNTNIDGTYYSKSKEFIDPIKSEIQKLSSIGIIIDKNGYARIDSSKLKENFSNDLDNTISLINEVGESLHNTLSTTNPISIETTEQLDIAKQLTEELHNAQFKYETAMDHVYSNFAVLQSLMIQTGNLFDGVM